MDSRLEDGRLCSQTGEQNGASELRGLVVWLNSKLPDLNMPTDASETNIRACLLDGTALCRILNVLSPGSVEMGDASEPHPAKIMRFLSALDRKGLPKFEVSDLEKGSLEKVFNRLQRVDLEINNVDGESARNHARKRWSLSAGMPLDVADHAIVDTQKFVNLQSEECRKSPESKYRTVLHGAAMNEASVLSEAGSKHKEVFNIKKGYHNNMQNLKVSDLMKWNSLDKASTQLLFSMVDKVLVESFERKSGDVPHRVACLLRKLVRGIERRTSGLADKKRHQNNVAKSREGKCQSKDRALERLATGTAEESQTDKMLEEKKTRDGQDVAKLLKEIDQRDAQVVSLKQEVEEAKALYENHCLELEIRIKETHADFQKKTQDLNCLLEESRKKVEELEEFSDIQMQKWNQRELRYQKFTDSQFTLLQGLREDLDNVRREVLEEKKVYSVEFQNTALGLKDLVDAAENYHMVLSENRKLYNEVQDLKGNIRVYCRIRPFLSGESENQTAIDYIGENGELAVTNPMKQGKGTRRLFKFNKVFAQTASQEEVFKDTQPLIRSVLDGYNVCIFAYGQTGSGKTYTMSGPDVSSEKDWGVNYRALHDLFQTSQNRRNSILYEVGVQMVEIYNEQVRDLLASDGPQKRLGIWSSSQPNGLAVPEASMHPVKTAGDVLELMHTGLMNRSVGATALNERSSRSHSILTVHVRGTELKSNSLLRGCLHLVDLAGSERVDRTEATGDRLKEAQHINKSLSALGDVIFALAQKNSHVPYRNSKLTQVLQSSLGGQAKTLMFVQLNPDAESYPESVSTLKFAERVSGVELGAARSNKEGKDIRELMEQVSSLKEAISRKDEEIERLRLIRVNAQKRGVSTLGSSASSPSSTPRRHPQVTARKIRASSSMRSSGNLKFFSSYQDNCSEQSEKPSEASSSQQSMDEFKIQKELFRKSEQSSEKQSECSSSQHSTHENIIQKELFRKLERSEKQSEAVSSQQSMDDNRIQKELFRKLERCEKQSEAGSSQHSMDENKTEKEPFRKSGLAATDLSPSNSDDIDLLGFGDADSEERLSDISDSGLSMGGTETDGSIGSVVEYTLFPEVSKSAETTEKPSIPSRLPKPPVKPKPTGISQSAPPRTSFKVVASSRKAPVACGLPTKPKPKPVRRWQ